MNQFTYKKLLSPFPVLLATAALLFAAVFYRSITAMAAHGFTWHFLVLPIFVYLIFDRRKELAFRPDIFGSVTGNLFLVFAIATLFAGEVSSTLIISELALVLGIWGLVLAVGGGALFRKIFWPLVYLVFISSASDIGFESLMPFLRKASAIVSVAFVNIFGYNVLLSDTYMRLPSLVLNVADECSGVNHLIAFSAMVFPIVSLLRLGGKGLMLLLPLTIPLTIFSNSIRITMLLILNFNRTVFTHGPKDILMTGTGFYIGLIILVLGALAFSRWLGKKNSGPSSSPLVTKKCIEANYPLPYLVVVGLVLSIGLIFTNFRTVKNDEFSLNFSKLNSGSSAWNFTPVSTIPGLEKLPVADQEYRFKFSGSGGNPIYAYIGHYAKQAVKREVAGYLYDRALHACFVKSFSCSGRAALEFTICSPEKEDGTRFFVWYASRNNITARPAFTKLFSAIDAFFHGTTGASIVIFALPASRDGMLSPADNDLLFELLPVIEALVVPLRFRNTSPLR